MKIGKEPTEQLLEFCFKTLNKALFEMSQNRAEGDRRVLANILQNDLNEKFHRLTYDDVVKAFHNGVRSGEQMAINPRTWFNWLNEQKMKSNAIQLQHASDEQKLAIETKCKNIDRLKVLTEFLELCVIELYEAYCNDEKFTFQGVNQSYKWLEANGFISLTLEEKERIWNEVEEDIKNRKKFVHNEKKVFHPVHICREKTLLNAFAEWRENKIDLRTEILNTLNNDVPK